MTKEEIWEEMTENHRKWNKKWRKDGCPGIFAEWLLENIERVLLQDREDSSRRD